jgi:DNA-binding response OmpR family regulator
MAKKILIADDEQDIIKILGMRLRANGYQIIGVYDGPSAIELAHQEKPDLIILDIKMPGKDGYTVFKELKRDVETNSIPVLFFSALPPDQTENKITALGADGFISKSADPDIILTKIKEILNKSIGQPLG